MIAVQRRGQNDASGLLQRDCNNGPRLDNGSIGNNGTINCDAVTEKIHHDDDGIARTRVSFCFFLIFLLMVGSFFITRTELLGEGQNI